MDTSTNETTTETTTEAPPAAESTEAAADTTEAAPEKKDPSIIGKLSTEEQQLLMSMRQQSQKLFARIGEMDYQKSQLIAQIQQIERASQEAVNAISKRLGVEDGQQWVAMANGEIRLVAAGTENQNQPQGGAAATA
jgi:hypothetical protein